MMLTYAEPTTPSMGTSRPAPPAPQQLLEQLLNLFEAQVVGAIGIFVADPLLGESRLRLVRNAFGYLDDIEGEAGELVQVNSGMLSKTTASKVLSLGHHIAELDANCQRPYIPAVQEGATHSEMISTHKAFFISFESALFLLCKGLPPPQAMGILYPYLNHQPSLTNYMKNKVLCRDLPSFNRPTVTPGDPVLTVTVTALTDHQLRLSEGLNQRRTLTIRWGHMRSPSWVQKSKHKKTHMVFQRQVATWASELGIQAPLFTTATLKCKQEAAANVAAYDTMISTEGNSLTLKDSLV
eukprot:jgi/Psemu1/19339/gm1.19339_g